MTVLVVPLRNMLVEGRHADAGRPVGVSADTARQLLAHGWAVAAQQAADPAPAAPAAPRQRRPAKD